MMNVARDSDCLSLRSPRLCVKSLFLFQRRGAESAGKSTVQSAFVVFLLLCVVFGESLFAQEKKDSPANEADEVALAREQMRLSREQVGLLKLQHAKTGAEIERVEHPVLRFTAPLWGGHHGTVWVWGKRGRPVAVMEMFRQPDGRLWNQAFHATSDVPIKLTATNGESWTPEANSLKVQRLPNAPPPADTPAGRIRQMKSFAQKFTAHEFWSTHPGEPRYELRLISSPVHRYEDREQQLIDGAMFIIAQDNNPEVTLFLEAIQVADETKPVWQYGLGRTGLAEIVVLYEDKEVFRAPPLRTEIFPKTNPYWRMKSVFNDSKDKSVDTK